MKRSLHHAHPWDLTPKEAVALQRQLAEAVHLTPLAHAPTTVAGLDVSIRGDRFQTAVVVLSLPDLVVVDRAVHRGEVPFPYIPGLLSFREVPAILPALERLTVWPDLLMLDGHGLAHPRRFGLACHLGLLLNQPALGVAKSRLTGVFAEPGPEKGDQQPLYARASDAERLGTVLRTRRQVQPVYVSPGHLISHEEAVHWTLACAPRFKIPEPTRQAHRLSKDGEVGQDG